MAGSKAARDWAITKMDGDSAEQLLLTRGLSFDSALKKKKTAAGAFRPCRVRFPGQSQQEGSFCDFERIRPPVVSNGTFTPPLAVATATATATAGRC